MTESIAPQLKITIDKRIGSDIMNCLGPIPEAMNLVTNLSNLSSYEDYYGYLEILNGKYKVVTNGVKSYIEASEHLKSKSNTKINIDRGVDRNIYEAILDYAGEHDQCTVFYDRPMEFSEAILYAHDIYRNEQKLVMPITANLTVNGKIVSPAWEGKKKLPLLTGWYHEGREGDREYDVTFYTQKNKDQKTWKVSNVLTQEVFGYRVWDEANHKEYLVLSDVELGEETSFGLFTGFYVEKKDNIQVTGEIKLTAYTNMIHLLKFTPDVQGLFRVLNILGGIGSEVDVVECLRNTIFNKYSHPVWFCTFLYWVLLSKGEEYPLHPFIFQEGSGGKSTILKNLASTLGIKEQDIWSGNKSTIISLVPHYGGVIPNPGWMVKQRHIGLLDEFYGRVSSKDKEDVLESYDILKDMLDHNKSDSLSGRGDVGNYATAQFIFMSNLKYGIRDLPSYMQRSDAALVERQLVYFMNHEHEQFIKDNREDVVARPKEKDTFPEVKEFVQHLIIHSKSFNITGVNYEKIRAIREGLLKVNEFEDSDNAQAIENYINARMTHHIICLLDGLVKLKHYQKGIYTGDMTPTDDDYVELQETLEIIARSWTNSFDIKKFSLDARVRMLRGHSREIYSFIKEGKGKVLESDIVTYIENVMKLDTATAAKSMKQLLEWEVVAQHDGNYLCFWRDEAKELKRPTIKPNEIVVEERGRYGAILDLIKDTPGLTFDELKEQFADAKKILDELERKGKIYRPDGKGYILHGGQVSL